jgi:FkbM family methyltransferase
MHPLLKSALVHAALPITRFELPGWGPLYRRLAEGDLYWNSLGWRKVRGKLHGYRMSLDLSKWSDRQTYFLGRYYDLPSQLFLMHILRPRDRFVDIGANVGMMTLLASSLVGRTGTVDAYEPNPACCERLRATVQENQIPNIRLHPHALGDREQVLKLSMIPWDTGMSTLCRVPREEQAVFSEHLSVPVKLGDASIGADRTPVRAIKIDVEGFEGQVLAGLEKTIARFRPIVLVETEAGHLARAERTPRDLVRLMSNWGYDAFGLLTARQLLRHKLKLYPIPRDSDSFPQNVVFCDASVTEELQDLMEA